MLFETEDLEETAEVQVYHFNPGTGEWEDQGCGAVYVISGTDNQTENQLPRLEVVSTDGSGPILSDEISSDTSFTLEGECGITYWSVRDSLEKALSFDRDSACQEVREMLELATMYSTGGGGSPTVLKCEELSEMYENVMKLSASGSTLSVWCQRANVLEQLLCIFHGIGVADPTISNQFLHSSALLIHSIVVCLLQHVTAQFMTTLFSNVHVWLHVLMLFDYVASSGSAEEGSLSEWEAVDPPSTFVGPCDFSLITQHRPPWTAQRLRWKHLEGFGAHGVMRLVGPFQSDAVVPLIQELARAQYWTEHMVPTVAGQWDACLAASQHVVDEHMVAIVDHVRSDEQLLRTTLDGLTKQRYPATRPYHRFLHELFGLGKAVFKPPRGIDLCAELAPLGLFSALFDGLDARGGGGSGSAEDRAACARLLDASVGVGPPLFTNGTAFKTHLLVGGVGDYMSKVIKPDLFQVLARLCVEADGASACGHDGDPPWMYGFSIVEGLLEGAYQQAAAPPEETEPATISELDLKTVDGIVSHALPILLEGVGTTSAEQCYALLSLLGTTLEERSAVTSELEKQWRTHVRTEILAHLATSGALRQGGALHKALQRFAASPHVVAAAVRVHRCVLVIGGDVVEQYAGGQSSAAFPIVDLFVGRGTRSNLVSSSVLAALHELKGYPDALQAVYLKYADTFFSDRNVRDVAAIRDLEEAVSPSDKFHVKGVKGGIQDAPDEISKACNALMELELVRTKLLGHYVALCRSAGRKPEPPNLKLPDTPAILSVTQYSEVFGKVQALAGEPPPTRPSSGSAGPDTPRRASSRQRLQARPVSAKSSEAGEGGLLRKDSLMMQQKQAAKAKRNNNDPVAYSPTPPRTSSWSKPVH